MCRNAEQVRNTAIEQTWIAQLFLNLERRCHIPRFAGMASFTEIRYSCFLTNSQLRKKNQQNLKNRIIIEDCVMPPF